VNHEAVTPHSTKDSVRTAVALVYNKKNGYLSYDADGSGSKYNAILFFKLKSGLAMAEKDFYII
jgi:hypothetical protein